MNCFIVESFITFSYFKFINLKTFADSYSMYDLLAKRIRGYDLVYPSIGQILGIVYMAHFTPRSTYIAMDFSGLGVIRSGL